MKPARSVSALHALLETTVAAMLATSGIAVGCGGGLAHEENDTSLDSDASARPDGGDAHAEDVVVPQLECGLGVPSFDVSACGEGGNRMRDDYSCGSATRQVPCDLTVDAGGAVPPLCDSTRLPDELCAVLCWRAGDRCNVDGGPRCTGASHVTCRVMTRARGRTVECQDECPGGRRLGGYGGERSTAEHPLGRFFARLAQLETVSIVAFGVLATELAHHGAPPDLVRRALSARRDEVRHARVTWALARRFGARPTRLVRAAKMAPRSLLEMAKENAREGCVRETYGAAITAHQARAATDGEIARVMESVARDESEHAALAWDLHRFFETRLDSSARSEVSATLREAFAELRTEARSAERTKSRTAGLPDRNTAIGALDRLERALLAA